MKTPVNPLCFQTHRSPPVLNLGTGQCAEWPAGITPLCAEVPFIGVLLGFTLRLSNLSGLFPGEKE